MNRASRVWCMGPDVGDEYDCMPPWQPCVKVAGSTLRFHTVSFMSQQPHWSLGIIATHLAAPLAMFVYVLKL